VDGTYSNPVVFAFRQSGAAGRTAARSARLAQDSVPTSRLGPAGVYSELSSGPSWTALVSTIGAVRVHGFPRSCETRIC
jgi:hypothetical protein